MLLAGVTVLVVFFLLPDLLLCTLSTASLLHAFQVFNMLLEQCGLDSQ